MVITLSMEIIDLLETKFSEKREQLLRIIEIKDQKAADRSVLWPTVLQRNPLT